MQQNNKVAFLIDKRDMSNIYENKAVMFTGEVKIYGIFDIPLRLFHMLSALRLFIKNTPNTLKSIPLPNWPKAWQFDADHSKDTR